MFQAAHKAAASTQVKEVVKHTAASRSSVPYFRFRDQAVFVLRVDHFAVSEG